ncbi:MAG: DUF2079 domain-containing protein, partial [Chitinivibrionales bacterium]|nr:DUF2079 domain-containing protein [Chitinivibrionales bacterium]MBD3395581.1 DUF2079 domain-containing protein [Chitinivibrionales bacterium]
RMRKQCMTTPTAMVGAICVFGISLFSSFILPSLLQPAFDGPDGALWVRPFTIWIGLVAAVFCILLPLARARFRDTESILLLGTAFFLGGVLLFVGIQRFSSGLRELESFHEGRCLRIGLGVPLFPDPEKAPLGSYYTPLLYVLGGVLYRVFPGASGYGRLISLSAVAVTAAFAFVIARMHFRSEKAGLWACTLFLGTYSIMGKMYDWVLVDPLMMCLLVVSLYFLMKDTPRGDFSALWFAGLACLTKQTALLPFAVVLAFAVTRRRPWWVYTPVVCWILLGGVMIAATDGRAWLYLVAERTGQNFKSWPHPDAMMRLFVFQLPLWAMAALSLRRNRSVRFEICSVSVLLICIAGAWKGGGWINTVFPFEPFLCVAAAGIAGKWKLLGVVQLVLGIYNPFATIYPWATIRNPDQRAVTIARSVDGDVWFPAQPYLYGRAGKPVWEDFGSLEARAAGGIPPPDRFMTALQRKHFECIIMRRGGAFWFGSVSPAIHQAVTCNYMQRTQGELIIFEPTVETSP